MPKRIAMQWWFFGSIENASALIPKSKNNSAMDAAKYVLLNLATCKETTT